MDEVAFERLLNEYRDAVIVVTTATINANVANEDQLPLRQREHRSACAHRDRVRNKIMHAYRGNHS